MAKVLELHASAEVGESLQLSMLCLKTGARVRSIAARWIMFGAVGAVETKRLKA